MDVAATIRRARHRAGLTQAGLAELSATSQATLSAYEGGSKVPSAATLDRILAAAGVRLSTEAASRPVHSPTRATLDRSGQGLRAVIELAELLPTRHGQTLRYPLLPTRRDGEL